jgi:hypothetical protein
MALPEQFDLSRYEPPPDRAKDLRYWLEMVKLRVIVRQMLDEARLAVGGGEPSSTPEPEDVPTKSSVDLGKDLRVLTSALLENPHPGSSMASGEATTDVRETARSALVQDWTTYDAVCESELLADEEFGPYREAARTVDGRSVPPKASDRQRAWELSSTPMWRARREVGQLFGHEVVVRVNLGGSVEHLLHDFESWLRKAKADLDMELNKRPLGNDDFAKWRRFKVFAYLDLKNWAEAHGQPTTHAWLGSALFPDDYDVDAAERVRKVVMPLARRIETQASAGTLGAQLPGSDLQDA